MIENLKKYNEFCGEFLQEVELKDYDQSPDYWRRQSFKNLISAMQGILRLPSKSKEELVFSKTLENVFKERIFNLFIPRKDRRLDKYGDFLRKEIVDLKLKSHFKKLVREVIEDATNRDHSAKIIDDMQVWVDFIAFPQTLTGSISDYLGDSYSRGPLQKYILKEQEPFETPADQAAQTDLASDPLSDDATAFEPEAEETPEVTVNNANVLKYAKALWWATTRFGVQQIHDELLKPKNEETAIEGWIRSNTIPNVKANIFLEKAFEFIDGMVEETSLANLGPPEIPKGTEFVHEELEESLAIEIMEAMHKALRSDPVDIAGFPAEPSYSQILGDTLQKNVDTGVNENTDGINNFLRAVKSALPIMRSGIPNNINSPFVSRRPL